MKAPYIGEHVDERYGIMGWHMSRWPTTHYA